MQTEPSSGLLTALQQRRAVRSYQPDQIDRPTIQALLHAAVLAPTAMHLEPWAFVVIQDRARLKRYSERAKAMIREQEHSFGVPPGGGDAHPHGHLAMLADPEFNIFHDTGTLIVICRKTGGNFADADCWLAAENLMLAATDRGLGTCCIGFAVPVLNAADIRQELGIPDIGAAVVPVILGVPREWPAAVPRKAPEILAWLE